MERPITITVRHKLKRDVLLELRDEIVDALAPLGISLEMTSDGTEVFMRHETVPHFLTTIAADATAPERYAHDLERELNARYGDPNDPEWKGDGCRG